MDLLLTLPGMVEDHARCHCTLFHVIGGEGELTAAWNGHPSCRGMIVCVCTQDIEAGSVIFNKVCVCVCVGVYIGMLVNDLARFCECTHVLYKIH